MTTGYEHCSDEELQGKAREHKEQAAHFEKLLREREEFKVWEPKARDFVVLVQDIQKKLTTESKVTHYVDARSVEAFLSQPGFSQLVGLLSYCHNIRILFEDVDLEHGIPPKVRVIGFKAPLPPQQAEWLHALAEELLTNE